MISSDNPEWRTYGAAMERGQPFIRLKLDIDQPIELGEFVGAFTALASEYDRFVKADRPGEKSDATLFVREVSHSRLHNRKATLGRGGLFRWCRLLCSCLSVRWLYRQSLPTFA